MWRPYIKYYFPFETGIFVASFFNNFNVVEKSSPNTATTSPYPSFQLALFYLLTRNRTGTTDMTLVTSTQNGGQLPFHS